VRALSLLTLALSLTCFSLPAVAQQVDEDQARAAARQLADEGFDAFQAGDFKTATDRFGRAFDVLRVPRIGLDYARSLEKVGRLVEASERYAEISRLPVPTLKAEVHAQAQRDAALELEALRPRLPRLKISVSGLTPGAKVTLDGRPFAVALLDTAVPVDPGEHVVEVVEGDRSDRRTLAIGERESQALSLLLPPPPPAAPEPQAPPPSAVPVTPLPQRDDSGPRPLVVGGWIGVSVGAAGLLLGGISAGIAWKQNEALEESGGCEEDVCAPSLQADVDSYARSRIASTVGFVLGGVAVATGATLLIVDLVSASEPETPAPLRAWVGPAGAGLYGTF
jgi:hypothetical protein